MKIEVNNSVKTKLAVGDVVKLSTDIPVSPKRKLSKFNYYMVVKEEDKDKKPYYTVLDLTYCIVYSYSIKVSTTEELLNILTSDGYNDITIYPKDKGKIALQK